jgi:predicted GH43/DUF377 family glycosyl hydrolase
MQLKHAMKTSEDEMRVLARSQALILFPQEHYDIYGRRIQHFLFIFGIPLYILSSNMQLILDIICLPLSCQ